MKINERTNDIKIHFLHGGTVQGNPSYLRLDLVGTGLVTVILRTARDEGGDRYVLLSIRWSIGRGKDLAEVLVRRVC